jgi:hypothetical protein
LFKRQSLKMLQSKQASRALAPVTTSSKPGPLLSGKLLAQ